MPEFALKAGRAFEYDNSYNDSNLKILHRPDNWWEITTIDADPAAHLIGFRSINGARCAVFRTDRGVYAQATVYSRV